ncbi:MAG: effector-associated domain EAD1-containing protein [Polyangiales bacterium]
MIELDADVWGEIEAERRALVGTLLEDEALREVLLDEDLRGGQGRDDGREGGAAVARWAIRAAVNVARGMLAGAADGARREALREAADWLGDEFPHHPGDPWCGGNLRALVEGGLRGRGVTESDLPRVGAALRRSGERIASRAAAGWGGELFPRAGLVELRSALCELFSDLPRARIVAADTGVDLSRVPQEVSAEVFWFEVIEEAVRLGAVVLLVEAATVRYPNHVPLARAASSLGLR